MKKKLISIILLIFIIPSIFFIFEFFYIKLFERSNINTIGNKTSNIDISSEGIIRVVDNIEFYITSNRDKDINIPLTRYEENEINKRIININVYCNGKELERIYYSVFDTYISLHHVPDVIKNMRVEYSYNCEDDVEQYNNITLLKLRTNPFRFSEVKYNITLPNRSKVFEINSKNIKVNKLTDNKYNLELLDREKGKYIEVKIDKGIINRGKIINEDYELYKFYQLFKADTPKDYMVLCILITITLILLIIVRRLTRKIKVEGYIRNPEELLDPIMAEAIIDRKIGAKELIMSCIVELIYKKKLRNIGNDAVEIIDLNGITEYERDIVELVFNRNKKIKFNELKEIFLEKDKETANLYHKFKNIKRKIENKIYSTHIYSKEGEMILKIIRVISIFIMILAVRLVDKVVFDGDFMIPTIVLAIIIVATIIIDRKSFDSDIYKYRNINNNRERKGQGQGNLLFIWGMLIFLLIMLSIIDHTILLLGVLVVFIINIMIVKQTKLHVFTQIGRIEYTKLAGLKNYIVDYSLMEQRDLESVIVWDEYLAYSVAFGISNKISKKFSENLMEANIMIQKIDKILRM